MYAEGHKIKNAKKLPFILFNALHGFVKDKILREALGAECCDAFIKLKTKDWNSYCHHLSQWERDTVLDC